MDKNNRALISRRVKRRLPKLSSNSNDNSKSNISSLGKIASRQNECSNELLMGRWNQVLTTMAELQAKHDSDTLRKERLVCIVAPILPHPCELELWNAAAKHLGVRTLIVTKISEEQAFEGFVRLCKNQQISLHLEGTYCEGINDNRTFLAGLEEVIKDARLVVAVGESSIATYQAVKSRRQSRSRLAVWQNAARPPETLIGSRSENGSPLPQIAREKTLRREVLKACDVLIVPDKDSSCWAYLEEVHAQRIRRVARGINLKRFSADLNATQRLALRADLGLPEADFIFLQAGPLEIESGALDSVYAFRSMLQSHPLLMNHTKLVFCGIGSAGAEVRQAVVDLKLDDHIFFLNPNDQKHQLTGNQMSSLLAISDAIIHNPLAPVNGNPLKNLDCSYDILCALASGLSVISNGSGWIGEWVSRFYTSFAASNIHSQAKLMRDAIEKQEKTETIKRSARRAIENELVLDRSARELADILNSLMSVEEISEICTNTAALFEEIDVAVKSKRYLDAIQKINAAFNLPDLSNSQKAFLFRSIGDSFTKLGDLDNGLNSYLRALELDPFCAKILIGLGTVALQRQDYNLAIPQFQKAVSLAPNDDLASLGLALAFEGLGELKEALTWSTRACQLNIENTAALYHVVKLAYDLDEFRDAEIMISRYISLHPYDVNMTFTLGGIVFRLGKLDEASALMENILMLDPMNSRAHGLLAQIKRTTETQRKQA